MPLSKPVSQQTEQGSDHLDLLSAIWILASNDENPEITYGGLRHRLNLVHDIDERKLVASHGELFRLTIPEKRLNEVKANYRAGKHLPSWLRQLQEGPQRDSVIERLSKDDFFRSQFRAETKAPRSPIQIIDWGLQHIDRLRGAAVEAREEKLKRWSLVRIPLFSTLIALLAISSSMFVQYQASKDQRALKEYEVSFRPKVEAYTHFIHAISQSFDRATAPGPVLNGTLNDADLALIQIEPLLSPSAREVLRAKYQNFIALCLEVNKTGKASDADVAKFIESRNEFRTVLYQALFER